MAGSSRGTGIILGSGSGRKASSQTGVAFIDLVLILVLLAAAILVPLITVIIPRITGWRTGEVLIAGYQTFIPHGFSVGKLTEEGLLRNGVPADVNFELSTLSSELTTLTAQQGFCSMLLIFDVTWVPGDGWVGEVGLVSSSRADGSECVSDVPGDVERAFLSTMPGEIDTDQYGLAVIRPPNREFALYRIEYKPGGQIQEAMTDPENS